VVWTLTNHNLPSDRARDLFEPSKEAESLPASIKKDMALLCLKVFGVTSTMMLVRRFLDDVNKDVFKRDSKQLINYSNEAHSVLAHFFYSISKGYCLIEPNFLKITFLVLIFCSFSCIRLACHFFSMEHFQPERNIDAHVVQKTQRSCFAGA